MRRSPMRRRPWRRLALRGAALLALLALTATLAVALQVREIRVTGAQRFPAREVEESLRSALGTPTVAARPEALRGAVRALPWVQDARVRVSLDGVVACAVVERTPVALARDGGRTVVVDAEGRLLGPLPGMSMGLTLEGFAPYPEERAQLLASRAALEQAWGGPLTLARRRGPHDVELVFTGAPCLVLADPARPANVADAHRLLSAWIADAGRAPLRLDARVGGRIAVLPAPVQEVS